MNLEKKDSAIGMLHSIIAVPQSYTKKPKITQRYFNLPSTSVCPPLFFCGVGCSNVIISYSNPSL